MQSTQNNSTRSSSSCRCRRVPLAKDEQYVFELVICPERIHHAHAHLADLDMLHSPACTIASMHHLPGQIQASRSSLTQDNLKVHARRANVSMHRCQEYGPRQSRIPADLVDVRQSCTVVVSSVNVADMQTHQKYFT